MPKKPSKPKAAAASSSAYGFRDPAAVAEPVTLESPGLLDIGDAPPWSDDAFAKLGPKDKRAYRKEMEAHDSLYRDRMALITQLSNEAATSAAGQARIAALLPNAPRPEPSLTLMTALLRAKPEASREVLEVAGAQFEAKGGYGFLQFYMAAAQAVLRVDPVAAFDRLSKHLDAKPRNTPERIARNQAIFHSLGRTRGIPNRVDPRWKEKLLELLTEGVEPGVLAYALEAIELDARFVEPLLRSLGVGTDFRNVFDTQSHKQLVRIGDARAVPLFIEILERNGTQIDLIFQAFTTFDDPRAIIPAKRWLAMQRARGGSPDWPGYALAENLIATLEKKHGVVELPPEPVKAPEPVKPAPKRHKPKARKHPKLPSVAEMQKEYEALFAKLGVPQVAKEMIRPAIQIRLTRVDEAEKKLPIGMTKFGGRPDLPKDVEWPQAGGCPLSFIGQVLAEDASAHLPWFPKSGLVSFFVCDEHGESPGYLEAAKIIVSPTDALERKAIPENFQSRRAGMVARLVFAPCSAELLPILRIPNASNQLATRLLKGDAHARFEDEHPYDFGNEHQLGGFRDHGYDAEQPESVQLLLQVPSDDTLDVEFGDVETLDLYAPDAKLDAVFPYVGD